MNSNTLKPRFFYLSMNSCDYPIVKLKITLYFTKPLLNYYKIKTMYKRVEMTEILPRSAELEAYLKWAFDSGIRMNKVIYPVLFPPGYIGTMATEQINPGDTVVSVPNSLLLTSKVAENSELGDLFEEYDEVFDEDDPRYEDLVLITFLIWEKSKGPSSKWYLFIQNQPLAAEILQDWSVEELQQLQDPDVVYDTKQQLSMSLKNWSAWKKVLLKSKVFQEPMVTYAEFIWAYRLLGTRTFGKYLPCTSFAPIAEYLNHHNTSTYYYYGTQEASLESAKRYVNFFYGEDHDDEMIHSKPIHYSACKKLLKLVCPNGISQDSPLYKLVKEAEAIDHEEEKLEEEKDYGKPDEEVLKESNEKELRIITGNETYEAGSEVYMSYGRYSNRMLLATYGFALKENCYDYVRIKTRLDKLCREDRAYEIRGLDKAKWYQYKIKSTSLCKGKILNRLIESYQSFALG